MVGATALPQGTTEAGSGKQLCSLVQMSSSFHGFTLVHGPVVGAARGRGVFPTEISWEGAEVAEGTEEASRGNRRSKGVRRVSGGSRGREESRVRGGSGRSRKN